MTDRLLIGITGRMKSGKDTFAQMLFDLCRGKTTKRIAFADALKEEVSEACGVTVDYINQNKDNFRLILQGWGTDFRRKIYGDSYWIQQAARKLAMSPEHLVVFTDVRFRNEADFVRKNGGLIVRVTRGESTGGHVSEADMDDYRVDFTIPNDGTKGDLFRHASELLTTLKK